MELLALSGSLEYSSRDQGYNNGANALRSPGSALKPFLYARALEAGYNAATILEDTEVKYKSSAGDYTPLNYNRRTYGPVSMRDALSNSLNLSAVYMLGQVGIEPFYNTLDDLGLINFPERGPGHYGLGMVVGNPEVTMLQLARAYSALAGGGLLRDIRMLRGDDRSMGVRAFSPEAAYIVTDMLSDPAARTITFGHTLAMKFPFTLAAKTGTSTNYRDCWAVGYTPEYTVAVWTGNFSGMPTWGLSGGSGAAPILAEIFQELYPLGEPSRQAVPAGVRRSKVCTHSGQLPIRNCPSTKMELFIAGSEPLEDCSYHRDSDLRHDLPGTFAGWVSERTRNGEQGRYSLAGADLGSIPVVRQDVGQADLSGEREVVEIKGTVTLAEDDGWEMSAGRGGGNIRILYPLPGDSYVTDRFDDSQFIVLKAVSENPAGDITWFVDGEEYRVTAAPYETRWDLTPGLHQIAAVGPDGSGDSVSVFVE
jgi:penicillin-binding protein 1C